MLFRSQRGDSRVLFALAKRARPETACTHASALQDAARCDHLDDGVRGRAGTRVRLEWGPLIGFALIATLAVPLVILVYMLVCAGCMRYYLGEQRAAFNPLLHLVMPLGGIVLFFFPLYYQFYKVPPTYPIKYANWIAIAWAALGVAVTAFVVAFRPERLHDIDRVYVEDETLEAPNAAAAFPVA